MNMPENIPAHLLTAGLALNDQALAYLDDWIPALMRAEILDDPAEVLAVARVMQDLDRRTLEAVTVKCLGILTHYSLAQMDADK